VPELAESMIWYDHISFTTYQSTIEWQLLTYILKIPSVGLIACNMIYAQTYYRRSRTFISTTMHRMSVWTNYIEINWHSTLYVFGLNLWQDGQAWYTSKVIPVSTCAFVTTYFSLINHVRNSHWQHDKIWLLHANG
jgi:hypothetical protein